MRDTAWSKIRQALQGQALTAVDLARVTGLTPKNVTNGLGRLRQLGEVRGTPIREGHHGRPIHRYELVETQ